MNLLRLVLVVVLAAAITTSCQPLWNVTVYNNSRESIGVRLLVGDESQTWLLGPDQQDVLAQARSPRAATLQVFDPATCEVLAREELPEGPGVAVLVGTDFSGAWIIDAGNDSAYEATILEPNLDRC